MVSSLLNCIDSGLAKQELYTGALSLKSLVRIILDGSYVDQKQRSIFDMRETFLPMLQLLNMPSLKGRYGASEHPCTLIVY